jgi:nucleoside-diphosphate-sugar epimerase
LPIRESDPVDRSERQTEYGIQKLRVEAFLFEQYRGNGFPATVVPLSMVLGPNNMVADREQRMFQRLLRAARCLSPVRAPR